MVMSIVRTTVRTGRDSRRRYHIECKRNADAAISKNRQAFWFGKHGRKADLRSSAGAVITCKHQCAERPSGMSVATKKLAVTGPLRIVIDAPISAADSKPTDGRRNRTHCCRRFEVG